MGDIAYPVIIISKGRRDQRAIWMMDAADSGGVQLRYVLFDAQKEVDVIDANGTFLEGARLRPRGVYWGVYQRHGLVGYVVALVSLVFLTVLVRCEIEVRSGQKNIGLKEAKELIVKSARARSTKRDVARRNAYVHRIGSAKDFVGLFKVASRWWD